MKITKHGFRGHNVGHDTRENPNARVSRQNPRGHETHQNPNARVSRQNAGHETHENHNVRVSGNGTHLLPGRPPSHTNLPYYDIRLHTMYSVY
jgi:hypothetical protein